MNNGTSGRFDPQRMLAFKGDLMPKKLKTRAASIKFKEKTGLTNRLAKQSLHTTSIFATQPEFVTVS
jgi:hypothetical protein